LAGGRFSFPERGQPGRTHPSLNISHARSREGGRCSSHRNAGCWQRPGATCQAIRRFASATAPGRCFAFPPPPRAVDGQGGQARQLRPQGRAGAKGKAPKRQHRGAPPFLAAAGEPAPASPALGGRPSSHTGGQRLHRIPTAATTANGIGSAGFGLGPKDSARRGPAPTKAPFKPWGRGCLRGCRLPARRPLMPGRRAGGPGPCWFRPRHTIPRPTKQRGGVPRLRPPARWPSAGPGQPEPRPSSGGHGGPPCVRQRAGASAVGRVGKRAGGGPGQAQVPPPG